jgi:hypothetical protein
MHPFESLGVLGDSWCSILDLENTKVSEFKAIASTKFVNDLIKKSLNGLFDIRPTLLGRVGDSVDEVFFSCGCHARAP